MQDRKHEEMIILNKKWQEYVRFHRLKNAFLLPFSVQKFLGDLEFLSCEDNTEDLNAFVLVPSYEITVPQYRLMIAIGHHRHELLKYPAYDTWFIDFKSFSDFFNMNREKEKLLGSFIEKFDVFSTLEQIRIERKLAQYEARFKEKTIKISNVVFRNFAYYFIFEDGTQAKITHVPGTESLNP